MKFPLTALAFALAAAAPGATAATAQPVVVPRLTVRLSSYAIAPSPIVLAARQPVTLVFTNTSGNNHDFAAPSFFAAARIISTSGAVRNGAVEVPAHQTREVTLAPAAGTYKVKCSHFLHAAFGMKGVIRVS